MKQLGGFVTVADLKRARAGAWLSGLLVFAASAAVALRLGRFFLFVAALGVGLAAWWLHRRIATGRLVRGRLELEDDPRLGGVLALFRRDRAMYRVPLSRAKIVGRTRTLSVGAVRFQVEITWPDGRVVANLAVPFRGAAGDIEGVLPATLELDRTASRALDALSYDLSSVSGPEGPERVSST